VVEFAAHGGKGDHGAVGGSRREQDRDAHPRLLV
jgi:hypothetical protein